MIREINSPDWPAFCRQLTKEHAGALVKLEVGGTDGTKSEIASNTAFESLVFEKTDACSDIIVLRLRNAREIVHQIIEPIHIKLQSSGAADFNQIQFEAESGVTFLTMTHPVIHPQMLADLKPR